MQNRTLRELEGKRQVRNYLNVNYVTREKTKKREGGGVDGPGYAFREAVVRALEQKYERAAAINYAMVFFASAEMKARVLLHVCINIYRLEQSFEGGEEADELRLGPSFRDVEGSRIQIYIC
jgi:hypothetical protein